VRRGVLFLLKLSLSCLVLPGMGGALAGCTTIVVQSPDALSGDYAPQRHVYLFSRVVLAEKADVFARVSGLGLHADSLATSLGYYRADMALVDDGHACRSVYFTGGRIVTETATGGY